MSNPLSHTSQGCYVYFTNKKKKTERELEEKLRSKLSIWEPQNDRVEKMKEKQSFKMAGNFLELKDMNSQ